METNASEKSNLFIGVRINKLQPMGASAGQTGQHSPDGMIGLVHSFISSQMISSHRTAPLSHTQTRHGSGFHTSLSLYCRASWMQPPASSEDTSRGVDGQGVGTAVMSENVWVFEKELDTERWKVVKKEKILLNSYQEGKG